MAVDPKQVQAAFLAAVQAGPTERSDILDRLCAGDAELRRRVELLLLAHDDSADLPPVAATGEFAPAAAANASALTTSDYQPTTEPGTLIAGRYTLVENIGEGGMGEVWVAKQTEPVKRKVALKLIKAGMDSKAVLQRFEAERQALALMDHPNIARVLDGGMTDDRRPFFVMELVKGLPLTKFCDEVKLTPRQRLELFVPICQAVQHAHQKGIVHRDLKPSNILVTIVDGVPIPKVIDFGVAKATAGRLTDESMSTLFGAVVGTLEYMSPEQAGHAGDDVDTRADIYSLGVILYELLTGLRPMDSQRLRKAAVVEMIRMIQEEEPSKPSTRLSTDAALPSLAAMRQTDPGKLMAMLRGELDWVVMKCLEKDRNRRYQTANGLARDIQRYLADEVVEARPASFGYRAAKFLRRNKAVVAAASVMVLALVLGMAAATFGLLRAREKEAEAHAAADREREAKMREAKHRAEAERARDQARHAVDEYFTLVSQNKLLRSPLPGLQPLRKELLDGALKYYRAFADDHAEDPALRAELARAYERVGQITALIGPVEDARMALDAALSLSRQLVRERPDDVLLRVQLADNCRRLGGLTEAKNSVTPAEALKLLEEARDLYLSIIRSHPEQVPAQQGLGECYSGLADWHYDNAKLAEEARYLTLALDHWSRMAAGNPIYRIQVASAAMTFGYYYTRTGAAADALNQFDQAQKALELLLKDTPNDLETRAELRRVFTNIAFAHHLQTRRLDQAQIYYAKALDVAERLARENPAVVRYHEDRASMYSQLAQVATEQGREADAIAQIKQAIAVAEDLVRRDPTSRALQRGLAEFWITQAEIEQSFKRWESVRSTAARARDILEPLYRIDPVERSNGANLSKSLVYVGLGHTNSGESAEAIRSFERAAAVLEPRVQDPAPMLSDFSDLAFVYLAMAGALDKAQRAEDAKIAHQKALALRLTLIDKQPSNLRYVSHVSVSCHKVADLHLAAQDREAGLRVLLQGRDAMRKAPQPQALHLLTLAQFCIRIGANRETESAADMDEAMAALKQAAAADAQILPALRNDKRYDPLRGRDDFKKLLVDLDKAAPANNQPNS